MNVSIDLQVQLRRLYWLTAAVGVLGFVSYFVREGPLSALGFGLGAVGSFGNLWLFDWLSGAIAPGKHTQKPWPAALFIGRYLVLWLIGYVIVKTLGVSPIAVILGLFASTAAVLISSVIEIIQGFRGH